MINRQYLDYAKLYDRATYLMIDFYKITCTLGDLSHLPI